MGLNDYTLEELDAMLAHAEDLGLDEYDVYDTMQEHYSARHVAKFLFLELFEGVDAE